MLKHGELKPFVEAHSEFACKRVGSRMLITWAADPAPSSASAIDADSHSDETLEEVGDSEDVGFDCFAEGFK